MAERVLAPRKTSRLVDVYFFGDSHASFDASKTTLERTRKAVNYIRYLLSGFESHVVLPKSGKLTSETIDAAVSQAKESTDEPYLSEIYIKLAVFLVEMKNGDNSHSDEANAIINKFYDSIKFKFL